MQYYWIAAFEDGEVLRQRDNGQEISFGEVEKKAKESVLVRLSLVPASPLLKGVFSVDLETGSFLAQGAWIPVKAPEKLSVVYFRRRRMDLTENHLQERTFYFLGWQAPSTNQQMALRIDPVRQLWCLTAEF